jgi:hypothetical protein
MKFQENQDILLLSRTREYLVYADYVNLKDEHKNHTRERQNIY